MKRTPPPAQAQCHLCKLFSNPGRILVLQELAGGERTVSQLVARTGLAQSNVSQHLAAMRAQDLLVARREGRFIHYALAYPELAEALRLFQSVLEKKRQKLASG